MRKYHVIVLGGGFAGCAAAIAAARNGCNTLLVEQSGYLGGAAANCLVNPFMPYSTTVEKDGKTETLVLSRGIFREICERLEQEGALSGHVFHEEYLKLVLDSMVMEAGVQVLFHSVLTDVIATENNLKGITVINKGGKQTFEAEYFIDCTGDADLAVMSGCPYHLGREQDHLCQPMTLCFRVANVDMEEFRRNSDIEKMQAVYKSWQAAGKTKNPRENVLIFSHIVNNVMHFNSTRIVRKNPVDAFDLSMAEMEARRQAFELFQMMKEEISSFRNAQFLISAPWIGVRESRMIDGEHLLTAEELKACTRFEDAIAAGNYDIDIHNPEGSGTSHYYFPAGQYYTIPYRSLLPKGMQNLLVAGRCISSTHEAQASYRIMPIVCCLGEAAGVGAAVAHRQHSAVRDADIREIQRILVENGAFIGI